MVGDGKKTTYYYHQLLPATGQPELVRGACGRGHLSDLHVPRTGSDGLETTQSSAITVSLPPTTAAAAIRCSWQLLYSVPRFLSPTTILVTYVHGGSADDDEPEGSVSLELLDLSGLDLKG